MIIRHGNSKVEKNDISTSDYTLDLEKNIVKGVDNVQKQLADQRQAIVNYNENIHVVDKCLKNKKFVNHQILFRLFKENIIEEIILNDVTTYSKKNKQIPIATDGGTRQKLIDNPLLYIYEGIVVDFDEKLLKNGFEFLKKGLHVDLGYFSLQNERYYPDLTKRDLPIGEDEIINGAHPYPNYEGYVLTHASVIESYYTDDSKEIIYK